MLESQEESQPQEPTTPKKAEPVYIIDDDDEDDDVDAIPEEEESSPPIDLQSPPSYADTDSDCFERPRGRYTSDSESDCRPYKPSRSGRSTPEYAGGHRKSVSFDLSGDERSKSDYERSRSRTPDRFTRAYDSEQDTRSKISSRMPRKGILRATSPSSSASSTLERRPDPLPPIVPTVARIREVESPKLQHVSRATSPDPPEGELDRENPFRQVHPSEDDEYTQIARAISMSPRSPRNQFFFGGARSNEDLLEQSPSSGRSTPSTVISKSTENLTGTRPKVPPPTLPKPQLKKADLVRNVALETFQATDVGQGDFAVFEHDASTNTIHQVPKLPVRLASKTPRPRESPPPPPVNFATMPKSPLPRLPSPLVEESAYMEALPPAQLRPHDFVHENSPDNILVTPEQHRDFLLRENEMRNQLRAPYEPAPPIPIAGISGGDNGGNNNNYAVNYPFLDSSDTDIDSLPLPPPPPPPIPTSMPSPPTPTNADPPTMSAQHSHHLHETPLIAVATNATSYFPIANANNNYLDAAPQPLLLGPASPTEIFPTAQILPVQYASLPQPQQPNKLRLGGAASQPQPQQQQQPQSQTVFNLLLLPGDQRQVSAAASSSQSAVLLASSAGPLYLHAASSASSPAALPVSETRVAVSSSTTAAEPSVKSPSYATMKFPTFSEFLVSPDSNSNYQNMTTARVDISNSSLGTNSSFSINSSNSSLRTKTTAAVGAPYSSYYETAEEIYSTIEEEAIYSNTAFFDSRRSSDTSLNCRASKSPTPPPLPPKRPQKPSKLRTAPPPPVAQKPHGLRGMGNFKIRSLSQPQLLTTPPATPKTPSTPTGKETTV